MYDIILYVIDRLRILDLLTDEAIFVNGVESEVARLQNELNRMLSFLKDADQSCEADERMRNWVAEIRNVSYEAEDVVDSFISEISGERSGCLVRAKDLICIIPRGVTKHTFGNRIQELNTKIQDIFKSKERYGIGNIGEHSEARKVMIEKIREYRRTSSYGSVDEVVGLEDEKSLVVSQLVNENWHRVVVTISGMGGIGKTTLAQKIYNSPEIKSRFDCCAWVCVSEEYRLHDLLQRIVNSFRKPTLKDMETMERMSGEDLEDYLHDYLAGRKYLLVLDDVWHRAVWESLRRALPDDKNGSRVIITTRNVRASVLGDEKCFLHELRFLNEEESWNLFCQKTSAGCCSARQEFDRNPVLEQLAREMVSKCGGLPLAIIVLGGLLSRRPINEWAKVREHIWQHVTKDSNFFHLVLELSFNDLPIELKPCFIYLSLFPEDHLINVGKLIRLWVAEGFIKQEGEMEEVAEEYLAELIDRSMIQQVDKTLCRATVCKVHDSLRELAIQKAKDQHLLNIYGENSNAGSCPTTVPYRRQAVHSGIRRFISQGHPNLQLRLLMLFNLDQHICKTEELGFIYSRFRRLRVLDLEGVKLANSGKVDRIPDAIGDLIHLRYLALRNGNVSELPPSIGKLRSLQTLVATGTFNWKLPAEICKLTQLRHLIVRTESRLHISTLAQLRTMRYITWEQYTKLEIADLANLRELELRNIMASGVVKSSLDTLTQLRNLQSVYLQSHTSFSQLPPLSHCKYLFKLKLEGKIERLHEDLHQFPESLTSLYLYGTKLRQDPLRLFGSLPMLTLLELANEAYVGTEMASTETGFLQLEVLRLSWLQTLERLVVDDKAMPNLRRFSIEDCKNAIEVPVRLRMLPIC